MEPQQKYVGSPVIKKDAMALVTGKPVYTDDLAPKDCLIVKVVRSPYAHALIEEIQKDKAMKVPGIAAILTWEDVPQKRFTMAGQTYPEPSPYDRLILDKRLRFVGDAAAIVAGETEEAVDKAMKLLKIKYQVLEPVLDFRTAKDNKILVHPEDSWKSLCPVGADNARNLCASGEEGNGDVDQVLETCDLIIDQTYHTKANQQAMMETFRAYSYMDTYGRLTVVPSTQVPFHVRRILSHALDVPKSKVRIVKPRIGGGFGAKQTVVAEVYPAIVTMKTGRPAKIIYTRYESQIASSPRHEMEIHVRVGADWQGKIRAVDMYTLSNTGAYGEHGPTTVGLSGHKSIPLYSSVEAFRFRYDVVYTNEMSAGAYRGYGATQGMFALESAVNELAEKLNMDPVVLRERNMVKEGDYMPAYYGETAGSCALDRCLERARKMIGWDEKFPARDMGNGKVRGVGVAMSMQGSSISGVDVGSVTLKVNDDGFYSMMIGAADMGTGCDTILAQIAADCLGCSVDNIVVSGVDTDVSPYDSGSYASSTTYLTGKAVVKTCETLIKKIVEKGAEYLESRPEETEFDGEGLITGAIDFVTNGTTRKVYRTIDHSEAALSSAVKKLLEKSNFELADISLMKEKKIPADCNVLIMNGLQTDISVAEKKILNDYLDKGGDAVIILADTDKETPNLYALVKEYGLEVHDGLVGDNKNFYQDNPLNIFPTLSDNHAVTSTLNENSLVLAVGSKGMTETQTARESIHMSEFMTTSEDSYVIDGAEVTPGQYILGATSWEKIDDTNTARVTIISASNLINNNITAAYTNLSNLDIFMNSILWCYDENVKNLSIPAKNLRAVPNTVQAHMFWDLLFIFIIPVGLLIVGFVVFIKRRKA